MTEQTIGAAIIILNQNQQVLLGKRLNSFKAGSYGLPGGRIKLGEKLLNCAKRELKEETNLEAKSLEYLVVIKEWQKEKNNDFVHFIYLCTNWSGELQLLEPNKCEGWKWFDLNKLPKNILQGHLAGIEVLKNKNRCSLQDI